MNQFTLIDFIKFTFANNQATKKLLQTKQWQVFAYFIPAISFCSIYYDQTRSIKEFLLGLSLFYLIQILFSALLFLSLIKSKMEIDIEAIPFKEALQFTFVSSVPFLILIFPIEAFLNSKNSLSTNIILHVLAYFWQSFLISRMIYFSKSMKTFKRIAFVLSTTLCLASYFLANSDNSYMFATSLTENVINRELEHYKYYLFIGLLLPFFVSLTTGFRIENRSSFVLPLKSNIYSFSKGTIIFFILVLSIEFTVGIKRQIQLNKIHKLLESRQAVQSFELINHSTQSLFIRIYEGDLRIDNKKLITILHQKKPVPDILQAPVNDLVFQRCFINHPQTLFYEAIEDQNDLNALLKYIKNDDELKRLSTKVLEATALEHGLNI